MQEAWKRKVRLSAVLAVVWLAACGGGDGGPTSGGTSDTGAATGSATGSDGTASTDRSVALAWTPAGGLVADQYHWVATDETGNVMAATTIRNGGGKIFVSRNSGAEFTPTSAPPALWISLDMTPGGDRMVAVGNGGGMFLSADSGATWNRIDTAINPANALDYQSVTISGDGSRIVAVVLNGPVWVSSNANTQTPTFTRATLAGGARLTDAFRAVDSSADGTRVVAVSHNGVVYVSGDAGGTFTPVAVGVGGTNVANGWYRVAMSDNGDRIAVVGNTQFGTGVPAANASTGIFVGNLSGSLWRWAQGSAVAGAYTSVSMSGDGGVIGATLSSTAGGAGQVLLSTDGGVSFSQATAPAGDTNWRALALADDASRAVLASGSFLETNGQVFVSPIVAGTTAAPASVPTTGTTTTVTTSAGRARRARQVLARREHLSHRERSVRREHPAQPVR